MQTFLPYPDFSASAACLDYRRLGKQRVEAKQLLQALFYPSGWSRHPACKMWKGRAHALAIYGLTCCEEWRKRGYQDNTASFFLDFLSSNSLSQEIWERPFWLGEWKFHRSHQSNLLRKKPEHYAQFGWGVPACLPYYWPTDAARDAPGAHRDR